MKKLKLTRNPYLFFSPFLLFFIILGYLDGSKTVTGYIMGSHLFTGDEGRYYEFAHNLLNGFYSPPAPNINLWNGPGFPIIIMPLVALDLPWIYTAIMNAFFYYLSIVFLFKAMACLIPFNKAIIFSLFWAFCWGTYPNLPRLYTEIFVFFLSSLFILFIVKSFITKERKYIYLAGFIFGYIVLSKIIFGYALLALFLGSFILWIIQKKNSNYRISMSIMLVAFITVLPYLIYTYNLTGKFFYFGNSGGMSLYWMSTPYENEYGDWNNEYFTAARSDSSHSTTRLKLTHQKDIDEVRKYTGVAKDDEYKKIAINNIKSHPKKYFKNIRSNISRSLFDFPYSYRYQGPLNKILYYSVLFTLMLFSFILIIVNWFKIEFLIRFIFVFVIIFLGYSSLVSMSNRLFEVMVPFLIFIISYVINKSLTVKIKFDQTQ